MNNNIIPEKITPAAMIRRSTDQFHFVFALFAGRCLEGSKAAFVERRDSTDHVIARYTCTIGGEPTESEWTRTEVL